MFTADIYTPLYREMVLLQHCCWKFSHKKVCTDFIPLNLNFIHKKTTSLFESPFGGVRGKVCDSSIAHWKAHSRIPTRYN